MSVIQKMPKSAFEDIYLKTLLHRLKENYYKRLFNEDYQFTINDKEINNLLKFANILCRFEDSQHRDLSLKIISLLQDVNEISNIEYFLNYCNNVLVKLGKFLSMLIIIGNEQYLKIDEIKRTTSLRF